MTNPPTDDQEARIAARIAYVREQLESETPFSNAMSAEEYAAKKRAEFEREEEG